MTQGRRKVFYLGVAMKRSPPGNVLKVGPKQPIISLLQNHKKKIIDQVEGMGKCEKSEVDSTKFLMWI